MSILWFATLFCVSFLTFVVLLQRIHTLKSDRDFWKRLANSKSSSLAALRTRIQQEERFRTYVALVLPAKYNITKILNRLHYLLLSDDADRFIFSTYKKVRGKKNCLVVAKDPDDDVAHKILLEIVDHILRDQENEQYAKLDRSEVLSWFGLGLNGDQ